MQSSLTLQWPTGDCAQSPHTLLCSIDSVEFTPAAVISPIGRPVLEHTLTRLKANTSYAVRVDVGGRSMYWNTLQTLPAVVGGKVRGGWWVC